MKGKDYLILILLAIIVLIILFVSANKNYLIGKLEDWNLVYKPESYTELYFADHLGLPTTITPNSPQYFQFTIVNNSNTHMRYEWEVYAQLEGDPSQLPLKNGRALLGKRESKVVDVLFEMNDVFEKQKIVVNLSGVDQPIYYWVKGESIL